MMYSPSGIKVPIICKASKPIARRTVRLKMSAAGDRPRGLRMPIQIKMTAREKCSAGIPSAA